MHKSLNLEKTFEHTVIYTWENAQSKFFSNLNKGYSESLLSGVIKHRAYYPDYYRHHWESVGFTIKPF